MQNYYKNNFKIKHLNNNFVLYKMLLFVLCFVLLLPLFFCCLNLLNFNNSKIKVKANSYTNFVYARVETSGVYLYKSASATLDNAYFELPKTYFVLLISNIDSMFYKAQYKDIVGYVKKTEVSPVAETPKDAYPTKAKFWVYTSDGTTIKSSTFDVDNPKINGEVDVMVELDYYGLMVGDELIKNRGYLWLFTKTPTTSGYLYKGLCDVSGFEDNLEIVTKIDEPFLDNDDSFLYNLINLSTALKVILILVVTLPCFLIVYLLFKPFKLETNAKTNPAYNKDKKENNKTRKNNSNKNKPKFNTQENKQQKIKNRTLSKIQQIIDDDEL